MCLFKLMVLTLLEFCVLPTALPIYHDVSYMLLLTTLLEVSSYTCSAQAETREVESGRQEGVLLQTYSN